MHLIFNAYRTYIAYSGRRARLFFPEANQRFAVVNLEVGRRFR